MEKFSRHFSTLMDSLEGCKALSERCKEALGVQRHIPRGSLPGPFCVSSGFTL